MSDHPAFDDLDKLNPTDPKSMARYLRAIIAALEAGKANLLSWNQRDNARYVDPDNPDILGITGFDRILTLAYHVPIYRHTPPEHRALANADPPKTLDAPAPEEDS